eukprot:CCRYP_005275-RB/>CCRYP_005275-RB protein AED:0.07 eAED:0.07 QI:278/0.6/0.83/1/0.6/0.5/6/445/730
MATGDFDPLASEAQVVLNLNEASYGEEGRVSTANAKERNPERNDSYASICSGAKFFLLVSGLVVFIIMIVRTQSHESASSNIDEESSTGPESLIEIGELTEQIEARWLTDSVEVPSTQPSWDRSMFPSMVQSSSPSGPPSDSPSSDIKQMTSVPSTQPSWDLRMLPSMVQSSSPSVLSSDSPSSDIKKMTSAQPTETTAPSNSPFSSIPGIELGSIEPSHTSTTSNSTDTLYLGPTSGLTLINASGTPSRSPPPAFPIELETPSPSTKLSEAPTFYQASTQPTVMTSYEKSTVPSPMLESSGDEPTNAPNALDLNGKNMMTLTPTSSSNNLTGINSSAIPSPTMTHTSSPSTVDTSESPTFYNFSILPTENPSQHTISDLSPCFSKITYDSIDADISQLKLSISDNIARSHFLGGIVRLAAHDFMDFDRSSSEKYGPDGCFDPAHDANRGLPDDVWCETCLLRSLYEAKYSRLSRADFWIASANAVIRQTSINNTLDLKEHFTWGRIDKDSCQGSGDRIPAPTKCSEVESAFLVRMGLEWRDAVALLGAHSLGRGNASFSGHEGVWVDNADDAQVFDKQYYEELYLNAWRPRNAGKEEQDWTTGYDADSINNTNPRLMLNTDLCLVYDIESVNNDCCTRTDHFYGNAADAVSEYLGGTFPNTNNGPFYFGFTNAWVKATALGWDNLFPLSDICESQDAPITIKAALLTKKYLVHGRRRSPDISTITISAA